VANSPEPAGLTVILGVIGMDAELAGVQLEQRIRYHFKNSALMQEALTHKSFSNEQGDGNLPDNERLEFLGDAVLSLLVSQYVFREYPRLSEGDLTRLRAEVVSEKGLVPVARQLDLGAFLLLGKGEERSGGREKSSLLANALEALLGAVFCDGGFEAARAMAEDLLREPIVRAARRKAGDYKTRLQELLQGRYGEVPAYPLLEASGPAHQRTYRVEVRFRGRAIGTGQGHSKKAAEQEAARSALEHLEL